MKIYPAGIITAVVVATLATGCVDLTLPAALIDAGVMTKPPAPDTGSVGGAPGEGGMGGTGGAGGAGGLGGAPDALDDPDAPDAPMNVPDADPPADASVDEGPVLPPPRNNGQACDRADQCLSKNCAHGFCCDQACTTPCHACDLTATVGTCTPVPAGEDPHDSCQRDLPATCRLDGQCNGAGACRQYPAMTECTPGSCTNAIELGAATCDGAGTCQPVSSRSCAPGICMGNTCASSCSSNSQCQSGFFCEANKCAVKRAVAASCTDKDQCATGFCVDGVCCTSLCGASCFACSIAGSVGTCTAVPSGMDPRSQCPAQAAGSCGRAGGCNGSGGCRLQTVSETCAASTCAASTDTESPGRACDGLGLCSPAANPRSCSPFVCGATACTTTCTDGSGCTPGFSCQPSACVRSPGLVLLWRFDEAAGTVANDSSASGFHGQYIGDSGIPAPSVDLPPRMHVNLASRAFTASSRHAVRIAALPAGLRPANDFTITAWYRATSVESNGGSPQGAEIISAANGYIMRIKSSSSSQTIEFSKHTSSGSVQCRGVAPGFLNGQWHHVAGVASRTGGTKTYYDGVEVCTLTDKTDVSYAGIGVGFWVGRHGDEEDQWDFGGNIDEVRVYNRPLTPAEIAVLAQGRNL